MVPTQDGGVKRILIVGCAGSGKSRLAVQLGQRMGLPVVHLDVLFWRPGWKKGDLSDFRAKVVAAHAGDGWISDGNFVNDSFDLRLPRADAVIVLERSRWLCLFRVLWRAVFDRERPDLPAGCPEKPDWDLLTYIWNFKRVDRPHLEAALLSRARELRVIRLRSNRAIAAFLAGSHRHEPSQADERRQGRTLPP